MYCIKCGTKLPEEAEFCTKCGTKVFKIKENENIVSQNQIEEKVEIEEVKTLNISPKIEPKISKPIVENKPTESSQLPENKPAESSQLLYYSKEQKNNEKSSDKKNNEDVSADEKQNIIWPILLAFVGAIIGISLIGSLLEMVGVAWFVSALIKNFSKYTGWKKWLYIFLSCFGLIIVLGIVSGIRMAIQQQP